MSGRNYYKSVFTVCVAFLFLFMLQAGAMAADIASELATHFIAKTPAPEPAGAMQLSQAMKIQKEYLNIIGKEYGPVIGYKAGLTNEAVQKKFGVSHPLRGTLLEKMLVLHMGQGIHLGLMLRMVLEMPWIILNQCFDGLMEKKIVLILFGQKMLDGQEFTEYILLLPKLILKKVNLLLEQKEINLELLQFPWK